MAITGSEERRRYKVEHINAPIAALFKLMSKLKALHDEGQLMTLLATAG